MKKRILSVILALSLTLSLAVPVSAASTGIGLTTQLDTESVEAWTNYFKSYATNSELVKFLADSLGISATRSVVCWYLFDYVVKSYGLGELSLSKLTNVCSAYSRAFYNEGISNAKSIFDFLLASGTGRWQLAQFWKLMFGVVPEFVIDDEWGTSGIYRIKEVNSGLYVCDSSGRYVWADVGATVTGSGKSDYQWIGERTASDRATSGKVQIITQANFQLLQNQLLLEGTSTYDGSLGTEYHCIKNGNRQVLANADGCPIVYRASTGNYIIDEDPRTPAEEDDSPIITDPSYYIDQDGNFYSTESLIYDNSTHTYTSNTYVYNTTNNTYEYKTWNISYYINYTYVYNIGQSEVLEEYTQYYQLPDGRSSADLTKEELEQLNLNMDVINYQLVNDASSLLGLWHFDGDLRDSSFYGVDAEFIYNPSITYLDSGAFNGSLYIPSVVSTSSVTGTDPYSLLLFSTQLSDYDFTNGLTIEFRLKIDYTGETPRFQVCPGSGDATPLFSVNGNTCLVYGATASTLSYGVWNHIALTFELSNGQMYYTAYVNGEFCGMNSFSSSLISSNKYLSGFRFYTKTGAFSLDELRVSSEVLYDTSGFVVPSVPYDSNLVLVLPDLDDGEDAEVTTLSSPGDAFSVEAVADSPAYESLSALSDEVIVTANEEDGEMVLMSASARATKYWIYVYCYNVGGPSDDEFNYTVECLGKSYSFSLVGNDHDYFVLTEVPGDVQVTQEAKENYECDNLSQSEYVYSTKKNFSFTNTYVAPEPETGDLTVSCVNSGGAASDTFTYTVTLGDTSISGTYGGMSFSSGTATFTLTGGSSKIASDLPDGTSYTVRQSLKSNYSTSPASASGTITSAAMSSATFTNTYVPPEPDTGNLTVSCVNSGGTASDTFTYTVTLGDTSISGTYGGMSFSGGKATFTLTGGSSKTASDLLAGTSYTVSQSAKTNYTVSSSGASGTIVKDSTKAATFTNTYSAPSSGGDGGDEGGEDTGDTDTPSTSYSSDSPILAVKTQIPVTDYQIGGVRPTYPEIGLVWALVENGYITSIQIYSGYAWEAVDARIWTGSRWIPYNYFNVVTLSDMYDIVDASGNQGYEYLYSESGFWNWWQRAWTDFVKLFQGTSFGGSSDSSGSSSGVTEDTENNINNGEYASGEDVTVVEAVSDSGKGLWSIIKGIFGIVGNVFSKADSIGDAFGAAFDDSSGEDSAFYVFDVPLERMSPTG